MNKKGLLVAFLSLFLVLVLTGIYLFLSGNTLEVVRMYYTPADVLNQNFEIKEYYFYLNQDVKYSSFKAFNDLTKNSGFYEKCEAWYEKDCDPLENLDESFKNYFIDYFGEPFDIKVEIEGDNFVISGKSKYDVEFENNNVRTEIKPEFSYNLGYGKKAFVNLFNKCRDITGCKKLGDCQVSECDDSSDDNYIIMEYNFKSNDFISPKILFRVTKPEVL